MTERFRSENEFTAWLRERAPAIGDDAALVPGDDQQALTVDSQREGVHFPAGMPPEVVARRLLAVNLSDLAAVGAEPRRALCTVAAPRNYPLRPFFEALLVACAEAEVELVGGDLASAEQLETTLTLIGRRRPRGRFLRRSAAHTGQDLWLCGTLGESRLGRHLLTSGATVHSGDLMGLELPRSVPSALRDYAATCLLQHLRPTARLEAGAWLAMRRHPVAAIDLSDGLLRDARRLAEASGVDLCLNSSRLSEAAEEPRLFEELCRILGVEPWATRVLGGEDYALLFTLSHRVRIPSRLGARCIGRVREGDGDVQVDVDGQIVPAALREILAEGGDTEAWDHLDRDDRELNGEE